MTVPDPDEVPGHVAAVLIGAVAGVLLGWLWWWLAMR